MSIQAAQIERVQDVGELEDLLSQPTPRLVELMGRLSGDIAVLGAGGKMGPSLARMAIRASTAAGVARRIFAVSRFSDPHTRRALLEHGVETITGDLLDAKFVASLPSVDHVIYMAGKKFGSIGQESDTWAMNVHLPSIVCERFSHSRIVAFSTGNVYGLVSTQSKGSRETDAPAPIGEYAMSCLGRERIFEYYSRSRGTPTVLLRLNYANELRYGVLVDLARQVWNRQPVDLKMGAVNVIWQGDANALALQSLELAATPARVLNIAGPEILSVRETCLTLAELLDRPVTFVNEPAPTALLNDGHTARSLFGPPQVEAARLMRWIADWVRRGGPSIGKATGFQVRDGQY